MDFDQSWWSRVWIGSARRSFSIVAWSDVVTQHSVLYVPTVGYCVCCDIPARLIKPADWYATYYMGLFLDMFFSTSLIPRTKWHIMLYSLQAVCKEGVPTGTVTILGGRSVGHSKQ
jgi:hypothetical protein